MQEWETPVTEVALSYSSADAPVFVASTSDDLTGSVSVGMRLRISQSTGGTKYFIVVAITNSTITIYGGTDYTLNNETISSPVFSSAKAPLGFPLNPNKWTVSLTDTSDRNQSSPTNGTWYNLGSLSLDIPIGTWHVSYEVELFLNILSANILDSRATLSTSNNSESDSELSTRYVVQNLFCNTPFVTRGKVISLTSKTTYYLLGCSAQSSANQLSFIAATYGIPTKILAVCAYL
ncbi:MAG TPA: hypothetical protein VLH19_04890 [Patescibacteria group bacterium]|nr:hypothetical protein [Patescibacteria group bacterium]